MGFILKIRHYMFDRYLLESVLGVACPDGGGMTEQGTTDITPYIVTKEQGAGLPKFKYPNLKSP